MRPGVDESFRRDMAWLGTLVFFIRVLGIGASLRFDEGLRELKSLLLEETNYAYEALHLKMMRPALKRHGIVVPKVFPKISTARVLVMEEIPGVQMSHYIRVRRENPSALRRWEIRNGIEPEEIAETLAITTLRQILEENQFHGDLHPGNIMLLCDNRVALIDFGTVGRLETNQWKIYREMTQALARRDFNRAADYMLMMAPQVPARGVTQLRRDLADVMRQWEARSGIESTAYEECSMGSLSTGAAEVMTKYKVPPTWAMMRVGRSLSTLDASLTTLAPDGNFMRLYRAYFKDRAAREGSFKGRIARVARAVDELDQFAVGRHRQSAARSARPTLGRPDSFDMVHRPRASPSTQGFFKTRIAAVGTSPALFERSQNLTSASGVLVILTDTAIGRV